MNTTVKLTAGLITLLVAATPAYANWNYNAENNSAYVQDNRSGQVSVQCVNNNYVVMTERAYVFGHIRDTVNVSVSVDAETIDVSNWKSNKDGTQMSISGKTAAKLANAFSDGHVAKIRFGKGQKFVIRLQGAAANIAKVTCHVIN